MTILTCKFRIMNSKIELMLRNEVLNLKFSQIIENYMFLSLIKNFPGIPGKQLYFPGLENTPGSRFPGRETLVRSIDSSKSPPCCQAILWVHRQRG